MKTSTAAITTVRGRSQNNHRLTKSESEDGTLLKLPLAA
jgi:hypothetical protein